MFNWIKNLFKRKKKQISSNNKIKVKCFIKKEILEIIKKEYCFTCVHKASGECLKMNMFIVAHYYQKFNCVNPLTFSMGCDEYEPNI